MATINEIKQQAAAIKNATQVGENTAERVGGALAGLAELAEQQDSKLSDLSYTYDCSEKGTIIFSSLNDAISAIPDNMKKPYLKIRCIIGKKENGYQTFLLKANVWSAITRNWKKMDIPFNGYSLCKNVSLAKYVTTDTYKYAYIAPNLSAGTYIIEINNEVSYDDIRIYLTKELRNANAVDLVYSGSMSNGAHYFLFNVKDSVSYINFDSETLGNVIVKFYKVDSVASLKDNISKEDEDLIETEKIGSVSFNSSKVLLPVFLKAGSIYSFHFISKSTINNVAVFSSTSETDSGIVEAFDIINISDSGSSILIKPTQFANRLTLKNINAQVTLDIYEIRTKNDIVNYNAAMNSFAFTADTTFMAYLKGISLQKSLSNHIVDMKKDGDKMVHVSTIEIINDILYCTYYANTQTGDEDPTKHIARFAYCPLSDTDNKTYFDVQSVGDTFNRYTIEKIYDTIMMKKSDSQLYIMWTAYYNKAYHRLYTTFDVTNKVIGEIKENRFTANRVTDSGIQVVSGFSTTGVDYILSDSGIGRKQWKDYNDIGIMQKITTRIEDGVTYFYTGCYIGKFNCIIKSKDLITWEYVSAPTFYCNSMWENAVYVKNDKCYYFLRQDTTMNYGILSYYDLKTRKWANPVYIQDCQSRADFFDWDGKLVLVHAPVSRNYVSLAIVNENLGLTYEQEIARFTTSSFYPYVTKYNNEYYMSYTEERHHIWVSKFTLNSTPTYLLYEKIKKFFELYLKI